MAKQKGSLGGGWAVHGQAPMGFVAQRGFEKVLETILAEWERDEPQNYREWPGICKRRRDSLHSENGMSKSGNIMVPWVMPPYVSLKMGRSLGDPNWAIHFPEAMEALLRLMPCCRMNATTGVRLNADR